MENTKDFPYLEICIGLINNIGNGEAVRAKLIDGTLSAALLNCQQILDEWQLQMAAYKAMKLSKEEKMTTKTVYSEIIYHLYPTRQISQAFKLLGMKASDSSCVAVTVGESRLTDMQNIIEAMPGCEVLPFTDSISKYNSIPAIKKTYKIQEAELTVGSLSEAVGSRIASKDILT